MKKQILSIIVFLSLSYLQAEDIYEKIFGKFICKDYTCSDFLIHNPTFFYPDYYFPEATKMQNSILLEKDNSYWINKAGYQLWSDDDTPETGYTYYHFDEIGHIYKMNYIRIKENGYNYGAETRNYELVDNKYIVSIKDEETGSMKKEIYNIEYKNDSIILKHEDKDYLYCYEYIPKKIIYSLYQKNSLIKTVIYEYEKDLMKVFNYSINNKEKEIVSIKEYKKGNRCNEKKYLNNGVGEYTQEIKDGFNVINYVEIRNNEVSSVSSYREDIIYNNLGYKESIRKYPFGKKNGNYTVIDYYLLVNSDEILEQFFE